MPFTTSPAANVILASEPVIAPVSSFPLLPLEPPQDVTPLFEIQNLFALFNDVFYRQAVAAVDVARADINIAFLVNVVVIGCVGVQNA